MSSKYCLYCIQKLPLSYFLQNTLTSPTSRIYSTCIQYCDKTKKASNKKQAALQSLDPNIQPTKCIRRSNIHLQPTIPAPLPPNPPVELPPNPPIDLPPLNPPTEPQPQAPVTVRPAEPTGFLPADEWRQIQEFNKAIEAVQIETC